ncbi:MAG TPA: DUF4230 domain-containing protein [Fimbriimonadaceae bacterium]|nr:DUF4230 domain-containing protein [Fimbriimonadaceae bacterium]
MSRLKRLRGWLLAGSGFGLCWLLFVRGGVDSAERQPTPLPLVLSKVQSLGKLHTTRYTYQNVFEYQTSRRPEEWTTYLPGAASLVRASTRNKALVSVTGTVEAGVDLAQASAAYESLGAARKLVVKLPQPEVYEPQVRAKIQDYKIGMFWADSNIGFKAQEDAKRRMRAASVEQGIRTSARSSAEAQVQKLLGGVVDVPVEVQFN